MDAGILRKLSAVFKKQKTKTKKLNPSIHRFLLPSCTEPGSYRVTRIQTLEYILKSVLEKKLQVSYSSDLLK